MKYAEPTPIQKYAIPVITSGYDLMGCAQTGSGKTAAFLIPMLSVLISKILRGRLKPVRRQPGKGYLRATPFGLIILPTRELAIQIFEEARRYTYRTPIRPVVIYGGSDRHIQTRQLANGCDLLIAVPGRLTDMLQSKFVSLSQVRHAVLDEADRMLEMGFESQIREIMMSSDIPRDESLQTLMFSATFPSQIQVLARDFLKEDCCRLRVGRIGGTTSDIIQRIHYVHEYEKLDFLVRLLNDFPPSRTIIFVKTKRTADTLDYHLYNMKFPTCSIHGDRTQSEREGALKAFKTGKSPILIATGVASRGLDIKDVMHIINYDLPPDIDEYVHRIGRTARAGNQGFATSLYNDNHSHLAPKLIKLLNECDHEIPDFLSDHYDPNATYEPEDFYFGDD
ncbi:hypothetical protein BGZ76_005938 [Entomortierella beljakovae]|nr:hypothetical protein BGZ76_005938 [Entomortierella beljakovae]